MLVLSRKQGERVLVDGPCEIVVVRTGNGSVRIGVQAAPAVTVLRGELAAGQTPGGREDRSTSL